MISYQLTIEVKKRRNDNNINNNDKICYDQQQHNGHPRYSIRFQNRQHQQNHESEKIDKELTSNSERNQQDHQSVRQQQKVSIAATQYALTRFPFSPFVVRFSSGNNKRKIDISRRRKTL
ncbi:unnamed protein product [Rotaria sordida]|uniref:Uncharacterized protein n=1 Tax=Rotaria sordida TaxID=392033 RepID=A0A814SK30_9BILA|nr:unnamed protein product [Rotaria sordida]CAF3886905.1 unnamed protein product [Rotaria sordida]